MDHRATCLLGSSKLLESFSLELKVGSVAVSAPFDADERLAQAFEGGGRFGKRHLPWSSAPNTGHEGTPTFDGGKQEVLPGVVDDADSGEAVYGEADGYAGVREGMDKVGGACNL